MKNKIAIPCALLGLAITVGLARAEVFNLHHADTPVFEINPDYSITFYDINGNKLETIQPSAKAKEALKAWHDEPNPSSSPSGCWPINLSSVPTTNDNITPLNTWSLPIQH